MFSRILIRTSTEHSYSSSGDWRSDWTRDGDDLSERTIEHREAVEIHFAPGHPREKVPLQIPVRGIESTRWRGSDGLVLWASDSLHVYEVATQRHRCLVKASWVISSMSASPSGKFVVGQPPGRPISLWTTTGSSATTEIPELGSCGLLSVTDGGVVENWNSEQAKVLLWDTRSSTMLPEFATPPGYMVWGVDTNVRRAVLVQKARLSLFERDL
jgi:hypothetical protein